MSENKNKSQYEKLLSGTPLSATNAVGGDQEDASDSGIGNKKPGGLSTAQLSSAGSQRHHSDNNTGPPRD